MYMYIPVIIIMYLDIYMHGILIMMYVYIKINMYIYVCVGGAGKTGKAVILKDWNESSFVSGALYCMYHIVLRVQLKFGIEECNRCDLVCYGQDHQVSFGSRWKGNLCYGGFSL